VKIALASDHAGYQLKLGVLEFLKEKEIEHKDFGCHSEERVDYVDFAVKALDSIENGEFDRAILVCGTGMGMAIAANKYRGIRATLCIDEYTAEMSRAHNDSNCLTLGGRILPLDEAVCIVDMWLKTEFEGGRHQERLEKIKKLEEQHCKE
jgi:ribose 5-phosphate isomerase B